MTNKAELGINWDDYIIPSTNSIDVKIFQKLLKEDYGYESIDHEVNNTEKTIFEGKVGLKEYIYKSDSMIACPLDHPTLKLADETLKNCWPESHSMVKNMLDFYWPTLPPNRIDVPSCGCSCGIYGNRPWTSNKNEKMVIGVMSSANGVPAMLEGILHELGHHKLHALGWMLEEYPGNLITNKPEEVFHSPVRFDKLRPMSAVIHAEFSYVYVTQYYNKMIRWMIDNDYEFYNQIPMRAYFQRNAYNLHRIGNGIHTIRENIKASVEGKKLIDAIINYGKEVWYDGYDLIKEMDRIDEDDFMPKNKKMP